MSLSDAVREVADSMERAAEDGCDSAKTGDAKLTAFARELRLALTACAGGPPQTHASEAREGWNGQAPPRRRREEDPQLVEVRGGELDGTYVPVAPGMPVGAKTFLGSQVYERRGDGDLHLCLP